MINKLVAKIEKMNAPIVVGLDPMMKFVPEHIKKAAFAEYGETLEGAAEAIWQSDLAFHRAWCKNRIRKAGDNLRFGRNA